MLLSANIFQPLINVLAAVLKFFHNDIGVAWGLAILLLTVCLRLALLPLAIRQFHSMQRMQMHMPELKLLQAKYKDNKQRLQQETMKFYSDNNVNPFASCVPLLIQWPFLIAMFWTLRGNLRNDICPGLQASNRESLIHHGMTAAKAAGQTIACGTGPKSGGAGFLFINDLTDKPHGVEIAILLVLYIGTSIGTSLIMMQPGTDKNQRYIMLGLPVVFALITIQFPAGALLYYIFFNLWLIGQQFVFKQLIGHQYRRGPGDEPPAAMAAAAADNGGKQSLFARMAGNALPPADSSAGAQAARAGARRANQPKDSGKASDAGAKGKTAGKSSGNGNSANADASARKSPPPSPRKKKKRSGRRR